ncbi:Ig-like domain repeat protein [Solirubrobacter taibaiensis]|nr:Ig-like domain repeat protein [Solirubrobacter taibaiensis]
MGTSDAIEGEESKMLKVPRVSALMSALALTAAVLPATAAAQATPVVSPQVTKTGTGPTGYQVTFRAYDPDATRLRIKGEWFFSSAADSSASPPTAAARFPADWRIGDFPLPSPNAPAANWPVADMVKDEATGIWSWTTPLPSGTFTYQFFRNCNAAPPGLSGCTGTSDPANPPWNTRGSVEPTSQVYVPSDPAFGTIDYSWQAPAAAAATGKLVDVAYPSPGSTNPVGSHDLAVYTPPGYDANRATPYPLLIISHGAGGHEVDWSTQGVSGRIIDNLIATGKMQPAVVVATNFNGIAGGNAGYATDVRNAVIPFMEANYNISRVASGRAFGGLSAGGARGNELLFNNTTAFGYYGIWSAAGSVPAADSPAYTNPDLKKLLGLHVGAGKQDPIVANTLNGQTRLAAAGVPFVTKNIDGGHTWAVWREELHDFLSRVAFRATTTTVVANAGTKTVTATVAPGTVEPATPTGSVQFLAGSTPLGGPVALVNGTATLSVPSTSGASSITAVYNGDALYNASTSSAVAYSATSASGTASGSVPATLSLSLGAPAAFGAFTPGTTRIYETATTANVISTAGDATLSVADPSSTATGHLVNGTFSLPQPLQVRARNATNSGTAYNNVGSSASPLNLLTYGGPVSNDAVALQFSQLVNANDALRTGAYSKSLTFTLSTTTP